MATKRSIRVKNVTKDPRRDINLSAVTSVLAGAELLITEKAFTDLYERGNLLQAYIDDGSLEVVEGESGSIAPAE